MNPHCMQLLRLLQFNTTAIGYIRSKKTQSKVQQAEITQILDQLITIDQNQKISPQQLNNKNMISIIAKLQRCPYSFSAIKIKNPYSRQQLKELQQANQALIDQKFKIVQQGRTRWNKLAYQQKNKILRDFYDCLSVKKEQLVNQLIQYTGKVYNQSKWQVQEAIKMIGHQIDTDFKLQINQKRSKILLSGYGNVLTIYNSSIPLLSATKYLIKSLKSSNSLMLSPTQQALPITMKLQQCWNIATQDKHPLILCIQSSNKKRRQLIDHIVRKQQTGFVSYSGNIKEGLKLYKSIAQHDDCFAESQFLLDSFDAAYVRKDANLQKTVDAIVKGINQAAGSLFCSIKRMYVDQAIYQQFKVMLIKKISQLRVGDPKNEETQVSCISNTLKLQKVVEKLKMLRKISSLKQLTDQKQPNTSTTVKPKIFQVLDQGIGLFDAIDTHSNFNFPFSLIYKVLQGDNPTERINFATSGITFSIFSKDTASAIEFGRNIIVGTVNVNTWNFNPMLPYSARKRSGKGLSFSNFSMQNIVRTKAISW